MLHKWLLGFCLVLIAGISMWAAALTQQQADSWRTQIKETLSVPDPLPPPAAEPHGSFEPEPGIVAERITYSTAYGQRVPAILYRPKSPRGKIPGIVVVNGHGGDKYIWYSFYAGVLYARAGAAVLTYDTLGEGERNIERKSFTRAHDATQSPDIARRLAGLMITDIMEGVSVLAARPEVDSHRIGAVAYSMGTFVLSLTGALDSRLAATVLGAGGSLDGPGGYWDQSHPMCQGIPYKSLSFLGDRAAVIYALRGEYGPTLTYNGLDDAIVKRDPRGPKIFFADLQHRTSELLGGSGHVFETGFEPDAGHRPWFVTKPAGLWLEQHLHFPNWTESSVRAMPVTHISEWAQANHVTIDKEYATEIREGGERALGEHVPALTRDQLSVFTPAQWEKQKNRMTYEAWLAAAQRSLGSTRVQTAPSRVTY
ncbi:MAG TPA: alpha/beta fold hydrolase [Bryobacteraceae bacterium]|nr:alpha/beta fold hydrolase [Bryobacteraceae bacterium]